MDDLEMMLVMQDEAFKEILSSDPVLEQLENAKNSRFDEYAELMQVFSGQVEINGIIFNHFTLAIWCFLYSIKNPFIVGQTPKQIDIDLIMYILHNGAESISDRLFENAQGFCKKHNIDYSTAEGFIYKSILTSFRAMEMLSGSTGERAKYNLDWLTCIIKQVTHCCNATRQFILYKMSLCQVLYYVIQCMREGDINKEIRRKNSQEIIEAIFKRTLQLGKKYYQQNYKNK